MSFRLTKDKPEGMYEALHNTAFIVDREVVLRGAGENGADITLGDYCKGYCKLHCDSEYGDVPVEDLAECICSCGGDDPDGCALPWLYCIATGAAELRAHLEEYENAEERGELTIYGRKTLKEYLDMDRPNKNVSHFANCTMTELVGAIADKSCLDLWSVGDVRRVELKSGEVITVQIAGFNHDEGANGERATVSLVLKDCIDMPMCVNYFWDNKGGWEKSDIRRDLNGTIFALLPDEWQEIILPVKKKTSVGAGKKKIVETVDKLWLLSEVEIYGETVLSVDGEGKQYELFKDVVARKKQRLGSAAAWWERSPYGSTATRFCFVAAGGSATGNSAAYSFGVAFGLCI